MQVVLDVETNSLYAPTEVWLIVCKEVGQPHYEIFRNVTTDAVEKERFHAYSKRVSTWIGHNLIEFDYPVLHDLVDFHIDNLAERVHDTLITSYLVNHSRKSHSIEDYGNEFGIPKGKITDFSKWSQEMEDYCVRDVDICERIFTLYHRVVSNDTWLPALQLEYSFQLLVNDLHRNGFSFNRKRADNLLRKVEGELRNLDDEILSAFPARLQLVREITPRLTKHGTLNRTDFRFVRDGDLSDFNGGAFCLCSWHSFNASSHKQLVAVLSAAGWMPVDKTQTHIDTERELIRNRSAELQVKLDNLRKTGWKINEQNLSTLPDTAPAPARLLAKRILLEARRRTLTEWLGLVRDDDRIHGDFMGIGAWTHRMAHQKPNTANIPGEFREDGSVKLYGKEMRSLWQAPKNRLLVGVDAEGIQLRVFAHYIDDPEFTEALVKGKKDEKTDPHSLNQRVLGRPCKSRKAAKRFVYALLLGAGMGKLAQILGCGTGEAKEALDRLTQHYMGFAKLKKEVIPKDAARGYFVGLDGRKVRIPGETLGERKHLCMSGYLQNGEAIIMKRAALIWHRQLTEAELPFLFVNMVHDEWQTETVNNMEIALKIAQIQADSLRIVGEDLGLRCPLSGSYWNEDSKDYTIGTNWYQTH